MNKNDYLLVLVAIDFALIAQAHESLNSRVADRERLIRVILIVVIIGQVEEAVSKRVSRLVFLSATAISHPADLVRDTAVELERQLFVDVAQIIRGAY